MTAVDDTRTTTPVLVCETCDDEFTWDSSPDDRNCQQCALRAGIGGGA